jgi:hypothetical protein
MFPIMVIALIFVAAPIARAIARQIERQGTRPPVADNPEVRQALQVAEQRLSDSEARLAALEERVDFYEKLLSNPESRKTPASNATSSPAPLSRP